MPLERFDGLLQDKQHKDGKGQLSVTGEILRSRAVARNKFRVAKLAPESFKQTEDGRWDRWSTITHPNFNEGMYLLCTFKNAPLFLFQWQWGWGEGEQ
jgi:hypothetical protein